MARLLPDDYHSAPAAVVPAAGMPQAAAVAARAWLLGAVGVGLMGGLLLAAALAGPVRQDAELAQLLHGMVFIKGLFLVVATALVTARLGRAVRRGVLLSYGLTLGIAAGGLGWLWGLDLLALGSLLFWGGLLGTFMVANRDPDLLRGLLPPGAN